MSSTKRFAVIGNPIAHSLSPQIHQAFAHSLSIDLRYEKIFCELDEFEATVNQFFSEGGCGMNVTVPFKRRAFEMAQLLEPAAQAAEAVNTLWLNEQGELCGDNTDGSGLIRDLQNNLGIELKGKSLALLGTGGAARGVIEPLLAQQPEKLILANRTPYGPEELAERYAGQGSIQPCTYFSLKGFHVDVLIHATSAGLSGRMPWLPDDLLADGAACYDLQYANEPTAFMRWAKQHNARVVADGLGMLVEQAADAFAIWHVQRPSTTNVVKQLRSI